MKTSKLISTLTLAMALGLASLTSNASASALRYRPRFPLRAFPKAPGNPKAPGTDLRMPKIQPGHPIFMNGHPLPPPKH